MAAGLRQYSRRSDAIVLALPRGGVLVGYEVATQRERGELERRERQLGGRGVARRAPRLADDSLAVAEAPTLLIVGARDEVVIDLGERARDHMRAPAARDRPRRDSR